MDKNKKKRLPNPRQRANLLSIIFFKWLLEIFRKGYDRVLDETDLYSPLDEHSSESLGNKISDLWIKEYERCQKLNVRSRPSLLKVLVKCFGCEIVFLGVFMGLLELVIRIFQPIILVNLLKYFGGSDNVSQIEAFCWATGLVGSIILDCLIYHSVSQSSNHLGMKVRVACCSLIYRKILKVQVTSKNETTSIGQIINFLSNEVYRLDRAVTVFHYIWIAPIQTCVVTYFLYKEIDLAVSGGIIFFPVFVLIFGYYGKLISHLMIKLVRRTDERLKLTNEIISNIKTVKMYAWETVFSKLINETREKEIKAVWKNAVIIEMFKSFEKFISRISLFVTILLYILFGNNINTQKVYLTIAYYNILRIVLYRMLPKSIKDFVEALAAVSRIREFMLLEDIEQKQLINNQKINWPPSGNVALSLQNVSVKWEPRSNVVVLKHIDLEIKTGSYTAIVGQAGAGKSTLFQAILNEATSISGKIKANGSISYTSQEPWTFGSSIKQNILFGQPMNAERYAKVITVCQLRRDFCLLPNGENTPIGGKGINLSLDQRARIHLARAVYREADIYLLDDILSAINVHASNAIFNNCIRTFFKNKTVLLITHQLKYLKYVDRIIVLKEGFVREEVTYDELLNSRLELLQIFQSKSNSQTDVFPKVTSESDTRNDTQPFNEEERERLEYRRFGSITAKTYKKYFKAAENKSLVFLVFVVTVLCQLLNTAADYFIAHWVNVEDAAANFTVANGQPLRGRDWYVYNYGCINGFIVVFMLVQALSFYGMCMKISRNLHAYMLNGISYAIMDFFDTNPIGRIMKRFSKDVAVIDTRIPQSLMDVLQLSTQIVALVAIVASVNPWLVLPALAFLVACYYVRLFHIKTIRHVKRLEGITQPSIFNHLSASVQGLPTIRALRGQKTLLKEFDEHQDLHSSAWFICFSGYQALGFYVELLCTTLLAIVVYALLFRGDAVLAGSVALVISQCLCLSETMQRGVRQSTELESYMTSVERVLDYSKLPLEAADEVPKAAAEHWPRDGRIVFENVSLIYDRQDKPTLKHLSFAIEPRELIGIVGRAGAGKSSITNALSRLASIEGNVYIDNVPTSDIALQDLRSRISVVPQEPVLFSGTLRRNLDPFDEYKDHSLWQALEDVEFKAFIDSDLGLNMQVTEAGSNFNVGQRQLLCLARAIIRNNRILILDDANVDSDTDELIQKVIRRKFKNSTVLVISHRLNTIIDSCKILVMDAGEVVEFDHPFNLLRKKNGVFFNMVQRLGNSMAANLFEMARFNYESENVHL